MTLPGYHINPSGARGVLSRVRAERDELDGLRNSMETHMESLIEAARMRAVTTALTSVWNDLLALHAEAAETRIDNGVTGMEGAIQAFEDGDITMMEVAHSTMHQTPELEIDDAMVVAG